MTTHPFSKKRSQLRKLLYAAAAVILLGSLLASYMHWEANHLEFNENTAPAGCVTAAIYLLRDSGTVGQTVYIGRAQVCHHAVLRVSFLPVPGHGHAITITFGLINEFAIFTGVAVRIVHHVGFHCRRD